MRSLFTGTKGLCDVPAETAQTESIPNFLSAIFLASSFLSSLKIVNGSVVIRIAATMITPKNISPNMRIAFTLFVIVINHFTIPF